MIYQVNLIERTVEGPFNTIEDAVVNLKGIGTFHSPYSIKKCLEGTAKTHLNLTYVYESYKNNLSDQDFWKEMAKRDTKEVRESRGKFYCKQCDKEKPISEKYSTDVICKQCGSNRQREYIETETGYINYILHGCRNSATTRLARGRKDAGMCSLTFEEVKTKLLEQNYKCYYSNLPLVLKPLHDWQMSVDRVMDNGEYKKDNVVLCCLEFNVASKWTKEKINEMLLLREGKIDSHDLLIKVDEVRNRSFFKKPNRKGIKAPIGHKSCTQCDKIKKICEFPKNGDRAYSACKECESNKLTIFGYFLINLLSSAKTSSKQRAEKRKLPANFTLTMDQFLDKIIAQCGRCHYSNIPLVFSSNVNWKCSIERIDTMEDYTNENTVLICAEFQSAVHTGGEGNAQWTKPKFNLALASILYSTNANIENISDTEMKQN